jgi:hypothetical protein
MAIGGIAISPKYGVNPCVTKCFFCQQDSGLAMLGHMTRTRAKEMFGEEMAKQLRGEANDVEAPHALVMDKQPCDKCTALMEQGVIFISTRTGEEQSDNPYRTGGWCVLKEDAVRRLIANEELLNHVLKARMAFIHDDTWDAIGLPRK